MIRKVLGILTGILIGLGGTAEASLSPTDTYLPPFLKREKPFNIIFMLDRSGSMWKRANTNTGTPWGIFRNDLRYCGDWFSGAFYSCPNGIPGSVLNRLTMTRWDILSYSLTGGREFPCVINRKMATCVSPTMWRGIAVRLEDTTLYNPKTGHSEGLIDKIKEVYKNEEVKPKIALIVYSTRSAVANSGTTNYDEIEDDILRIWPGGMTCHKCAFEDAASLIKNKKFYYFDGKYVPCAKNFIIHMSDGEWNEGGDPLKTAYSLWKGGDADLSSSIPYKQNAEIFTIGAFMSPYSGGAHALEHQAIFGGFTDDNGDGMPCNYSDFPSSSFNSIHQSCIEWDKNGDGLPDNFRLGSSGSDVYKAFSEILSTILKRMAGSGINVSPDTQKAGGIAVQSVYGTYYDTKYGRVKWGGDQLFFWVYNKNDVQNLREDTVHNYALDLTDDYILEWAFGDEFKINLYEPDENGDKGTLAEVKYSLKDLTPVASTGEKLAETSPYDRTIYFSNGNRIVPFTTYNARDYGFKVGGCVKTESDLVSWVKGEDVQGCREHVGGWKLADSIYSQPVIVKYKDYYVAFVGANDGMVHAFRVGYIKGGTKNQVIKLQNSAQDSKTDKIGEELWAFIPSYMKDKLYYYAQPEYEHVWGADGKLAVVETDAKKYLVGVSGWGGRAGFVLDVTDPKKPSLVKEFSVSGLGDVGFAIVKRGGHYYAVIPPGNVDVDGTKADSNSFVKIVGIDTDYEREVPVDGFGSFTGGYSVLDYDNDGNGDAVVFAGNSGFSSQIYVLDTRSPNPDDWKVSKGTKISQPITGGITAGVCFGRPYVYFGTGRWFTYKQGQDDPHGYLYGIPLTPTKDGYTMPSGGFADGNTCTDGSVGWKIALDDGDENYGAERVISAPVFFSNGEVIFSSIEPPKTICSGDGRTRFWALNCATGQSIFDNCQGAEVNTETNQGTFIAQLTTGNLVQIHVNKGQSNFFTEKDKKATKWVKGVVPTSGTGVIRPFNTIEGEVLFLIEK